MDYDPASLAEFRSAWIKRLREYDAILLIKHQEEMALSTNTIVDFLELPVETQKYLEKKYGDCRANVVNSLTGPRYCHGGTCGCKGYYDSIHSPATGPPCCRIYRQNLQYKWSEGDPLFAVIEDGQFKQVEYKKE